MADECLDCNPCSDCETVEETCDTPVYTNDNCLNPQFTDCVVYDGDTDPCIPVVKNTTKLTQVLTNIFSYIKTIFTRLRTDNSLSIVPIEDNCNKTYDIKVNISEVAGNGLSLKSDGLYSENTGEAVNVLEPLETDSIKIDITDDIISADLKLDNQTGGGNNIAEITDNGLYVPPTTIPDIKCDDIQGLFSQSVNQNNNINQSSYNFLGGSTAGCIKISPPTGFAIVGSSRMSAFGKMEWFSTLTLANNAAVAGESVIIYEDTTDNLVLKNNVSYHGVGIRKIGTLTSTTQYIGTLLNLDTQGAVNISNTSSSNKTKLFAKHVFIRDNVTIDGYSSWVGGIFLNRGKTFLVKGYAILRMAYSECEVLVSGRTKVDKVVLFDDSLTVSANALLTINASSAEGPIVTNCNSTSIKNIAIIANSLNSPGVILNNCVGISDDKDGIYFHTGSQGTSSTCIFTGCLGKSTDGNGITVVKNGADADPAQIVNNILVSGNRGYSVNQYGIYDISTTLSACHGFSENSNGIRVAGSDLGSLNVKLVDCIAESRTKNALAATRDIHVIGGSYISHKIVSVISTEADKKLGSPILLGPLNVSRSNEHYFISGAKLISATPGCYKIAGDTSSLPISVRISGNHFLSMNGTASVAGIDPVLTKLTVMVDSYGNYIY